MWGWCRNQGEIISQINLTRFSKRQAIQLAMKQIHEIQLQILAKLIFKPDLKYTELKPDKELENNQFDYHLDQLIEMGLVMKKANKYLLTAEGKEYAGRIETETTKVIKQAKISAWLGCVRNGGEKREFLIYIRKKQPFYGCQGFCGGKIGYGELFTEAASREMLEETGLIGRPQLALVKHYRVFNKTTKQLLEDKLMFLFRVENPKGELKPDINEGDYEWISEKDLDRRVTNYFEDKKAFDHQVEVLKNYQGQVLFEETDYYGDNF